jgi:hypothetical protein
VLPDPVGDEEQAARVALYRAAMTTFCDVLQASTLPPMTVMALAAEAVGAVYRDVAAAHGPEGECCCGWRPRNESDIKALQAALAATARPARPVFDLTSLEAMGRA